MNAIYLERYKRVLVAKHREITSPRHPSVSPQLAAGKIGGDYIDQATADAEAGVQVRLRQTESHLRRAIENALSRIHQGTYGVCATCGQPIAKVRLQAVPWARQCLECKALQQG
jgi:RNA polymerase-binding protein DksA